MNSFKVGLTFFFIGVSLQAASALKCYDCTYVSTSFTSGSCDGNATVCQPNQLYCKVNFVFKFTFF